MIGRRGFLSFLGSLGTAITVIEEAKATNRMPSLAVVHQHPHCPTCHYAFDWPEKWHADTDRRMREFVVPQVQTCPRCQTACTTRWKVVQDAPR